MPVPHVTDGPRTTDLAHPPSAPPGNVVEAFAAKVPAFLTRLSPPGSKGSTITGITGDQGTHPTGYLPKLAGAVKGADGDERSEHLSGRVAYVLGAARARQHGHGIVSITDDVEFGLYANVGSRLP